MEVEIALDPSADAPARARAVIARRFADKLPAASYQDLRVVVTELVTNAVKYGSSEGIRVWLHTSGALVRGEVVDGGKGGARVDHDHAFEGKGLGLQIVDALCSAWCNPPGAGRVWFQLHVADRAVVEV